MNLNKIIFHTAAKTAFVLLIALCYAFGIFTRAFPYAAAAMFDSMGNKHLSMVYHVRAYESDKTIEKLYYAFEKSIEAGDRPNTKTYGKLFFEHTDSAMIILKLSLDLNNDFFDLRTWLETAYVASGGEL